MSASREPVVARAAALLRGLSAHAGDGLTTTEAARQAAMPRPTAHRLLSALVAEGLVDRDDLTGRWHLGPETYLLGTFAAARYDVSPRARRAVAELAESTGESAFFSARRGDETVCLVREDGSFPLRSHVLHEGIRFPLGVASAGLAILAHSPDRSIEDYLTRARLEDAWGPEHAEEPLRERIARTRRDGYALNPGLIVEGSWGMGAAVFDPAGQPQWALSLTGVETRFTAARVPALGRAILTAAHRLARALASP